jgi:hypothetical protein
MKINPLKIVGIVGMIIVLLNLVLFAFRIINETIFWGVIIAGAVFSYVILPRLRKAKGKKK